ncbi:MAG: preprotein translocase subunit SecA [bacterium]|nr:preprotein translocase subunit SecA [bacterium]
MLSYAAKKIFGTRNDRILKSLKPFVQRVNALEAQFTKMSDDELKGCTNAFKERLGAGETLDNLMPEAFAVVRETSKRVLGMRHFDVQLIGGAVLHTGMIAEMKTGEGKTLVATLPAYLNSLTGKGVHVVTVNDYLAKRDAGWMGKIYNFLGLEVGVVVPGLDEEQRQAAYRSDITYGQNNEFGFDYLRDNMKFKLEDKCQRPHNYAIVDEVDSILIDEARTPLIISGPAEDSSALYATINQIIPRLVKDKDYQIEAKSKQPSLSDEGITNVEGLLKIDNLYDPRHAELVHHVNQSLKAHVTMERDVDYVVRDGQVIIVDEFTGRLMAGRRWSDGLHQAVEAKEGVKVARENQTLASITFQNYFRMYEKLSGMTGTADTEAVEFKKIYNLEVVSIPTNRPMIRNDYSDMIYATRKGKFDAAVTEIEELAKNGQPVLVGTISIEQSEHLSKLLQQKGIKHNVLNAKQHEREAEIVAQAGRFGSITISTNMAGRGTDIMLGGNPEFLAQAEVGTKEESDESFKAAVKKYALVCAEEKRKVIEAGGLHILGTERHESRRIDNQLRGRSGRQGDPGSTRFYVSLEDDLMKRFGGERLQAIMTRFGMKEDEPIEGGMISKAIENAQTRVEGYNFDIRKHLLEYDDVMNKQREVIYSERHLVLEGKEVRAKIENFRDDLLEEAILVICDEKKRAVEWELGTIKNQYKFLFTAELEMQEDFQLNAQAIFDEVRENAQKLYQNQVEKIGSEQFSHIEQHIYLQSLDHFWKLHLLEMDHLKEGIGLRGYGQKNPLHEYQKDGFQLFQRMLHSIKEDFVRKVYAVRLLTEEEAKALEEADLKRRQEQEKKISLVHESTIEDANDSDPTNDESKDPSQQREKLKEARKLRRKLGKK